MSIEISNELSPLPGDASSIRLVASRFEQTAQAIQESVADLRSLITQARTSESKATDALADNAGEVAGRLGSLEQRYATAGRELRSFATSLDNARVAVDRLLEQQARYREAEAQWERRIAQHKQDAPRVGTEGYVNALQQHMQDEYAMRRGRNAAQQDLSALQRQYEAVVQELREAGSRASRNLSGAMDADGLNDTFWDKVKNWVSENAELLKIIHQILQAVTAVLSIASLFFPVLAPFALGAALLTAGLSFLLAAAGEISWVDFALDLLAVATIGVVAIAGKVVKGLASSLRSSRVGTLVSQGASNADASRRVGMSFRGVLNQTTKPGTSIPTLHMNGSALPWKWTGWAKEIFSSKGVDNATFLRLVERAKSGASVADDAIISQGLAWINTAKSVSLGKTVLDQLDNAGGNYLSTLDGGLERIDSIIENGWGIETGIGEALDPVADWYPELKEEYATWELGR